MNLSKVFAFSLLLVSPLANARVQMHTQIELKNDPTYGNRSCDIVFTIDANESFEIYNHDNVRVVAELLAEREDCAIICFNIFAKTANEWEKILAPVLAPNHTEPALLHLGSSLGDDFKIIVSAQKI